MGLWGISFRINRNILECKFRLTISIHRGFTVLIETYWNVNSFKCQLSGSGTKCINRNILECKFGTLIERIIEWMEY